MTGRRRVRDDAALEASGMATKLEIALTLLGARKGVGLSQIELATRAGWKAQFVCRLESLCGRLPNLTSIARYGRACEVDVGLLFSVPSKSGLWVVRAITLQRSSRSLSFEAFTGCEIAVASPAPRDAELANMWMGR